MILGGCNQNVIFLCTIASTLRYQSTAAQVGALDQIQPVLQDLQSQVKETLRYLNYNSAAVNMPPFTQRVQVQYSGYWLGLDPEDHPLLLRDAGSVEIYALTLER